MDVEYIDPFLEKQLQDLIDEQLKELGFADLCETVADKLVKKVEAIADEHNAIKKTFVSISHRIDALLSEQQEDFNNERSKLATQKQRRLGATSQNSRSVIIIDDDEDERHELSHMSTLTRNDIHGDIPRSALPQMPSIPTAIEKPSKINNDEAAFSTKVITIDCDEDNNLPVETNDALQVPTNIEPLKDSTLKDTTPLLCLLKDNTPVLRPIPNSSPLLRPMNDTTPLLRPVKDTTPLLCPITNITPIRPPTIYIDSIKETDDLSTDLNNSEITTKSTKDIVTKDNFTKDSISKESIDKIEKEISILNDLSNDAFFDTNKDTEANASSNTNDKFMLSPSKSVSLLPPMNSPISSISPVITPLKIDTSRPSSPWNGNLSFEDLIDETATSKISLFKTLNDVSLENKDLNNEISSFTKESENEQKKKGKTNTSIKELDTKNKIDKSKESSNKRPLISPIIIENDMKKLRTTIKLPNNFEYPSTTPTSATDYNRQHFQFGSNKTIISPLASPKPRRKSRIELNEGAKVYAKPDKSDIWYQAEIIKELVVGNVGSSKKRKYLLRFVAGQKVQQKILDKNISSFDSLEAYDIEIGSRVVAGRPSDTVNSTISKKYKDITTGTNINVMFAGVIAEIACEANRHRYLVFFDDGYAQYIPLNRMFPVVGPSSDVWEDVGRDCREFIKEYLQEYPYRPLVVTRIGNAMQTEWNGEWWKSKVVSVDSSLVKILFDIDKRSEWIYRGTTRLEVLYQFYVDTQTAKRKKRKMTKDDSYVDERITHPQFGISKFSLKDPLGTRQMKEWDVTLPQKYPDKKDYEPLVTTLKRVVSPNSSAASSSSKHSSASSKSSIILKPAPRKKKRIQSDSESNHSNFSEKEVILQKYSSNFKDSELPSSEDFMISSQEAIGAISALQMSPLPSRDGSPRPMAINEAPAIDTSDFMNKRSISCESESSSVRSLRYRSNSTHSATQFQPNFRRGSHRCSPDCITDLRTMWEYHKKGKFNFLAIPLQLGWKRESAKRHTGYHRDIYYRTPCDKRMRSLANITDYLLVTQCKNVCIDMFCFQSNISCRNNPIKVKPAIIRIDDLSYGIETPPVVCVNEISDERPPSIKYIKERSSAEDVKINTGKEFLACCDCTDFCQDKKKCACSRLSIESSNAIDNITSQNAGYNYRRLKECLTTGIYECNANCSCSKQTCYNRVVQNGIKLRLQVFLTENRGWGLRCVDDIAKGTFICTYTGLVLNEQTANREGMDFGDEYLAELDHIEVVEKAKDGYESDVPELRDGAGDEFSSNDEDSDSDIISNISVETSSSDISIDDSDEDTGDMQEDILKEEHQSDDNHDDDADDVKNLENKVSKETLNVKDNDERPIISPTSSSDNTDTSFLSPPTVDDPESLKCIVSLRRLPSADLPQRPEFTSDDSMASDINESLDTPQLSPYKNKQRELGNGSGGNTPNVTSESNSNEEITHLENIAVNTNNVTEHVNEENMLDNKELNQLVTHVKSLAKKSTGRKAFKPFLAIKGGKSFGCRIGPKASEDNQLENPNKQPSTRSLYGPENELFIIDAKSIGNVGRYMNHCCSPNLFVQNIMVDTHDLRFPWVAFFAQQNIPAYTELTWDYNYEVGSVPDKVLHCKCGSKHCKGRLL